MLPLYLDFDQAVVFQRGVLVLHRLLNQLFSHHHLIVHRSCRLQFCLFWRFTTTKQIAHKINFRLPSFVVVKSVRGIKQSQFYMLYSQLLRYPSSPIGLPVQKRVTENHRWCNVFDTIIGSTLCQILMLTWLPLSLPLFDPVEHCSNLWIPSQFLCPINPWCLIVPNNWLSLKCREYSNLSRVTR